MDLDFDCIGGLFTGVRARSLAWSPLTACASVTAAMPQSSLLAGSAESQSVRTRLSLCAGGHDTQLHYLAWETEAVDTGERSDPTVSSSFTSSSSASSCASASMPLTAPVLQTSVVLSGHRSAPTHCTFHSRTDRLVLASAADDLTAKVWDLSTQQITTELFTPYPPVAVQWHPAEPEQVGGCSFPRVMCSSCVMCALFALAVFSPASFVPR
jgi:WD40 repeat protein